MRDIMKIILSPAKKMNVDEDSIRPYNLPIFLKETKKILKYLQGLSYEELKKLWGTNDKITQQNIDRFAQMNLENRLTPALFSYEGIQYQYMGVQSLDDNMIEYLEENLRIISGFYGILKPMDGVTPYRLEMQAKTKIGKIDGLYDFWGKKIYGSVVDDSRIIINLASKEYSKCIEPYITKKDRYISCNFLETHNGKLVQKGTYAKMARGYMVRFMAENKIEKEEDIKEFDGLDYRFDKSNSTDTNYIFVKNV